MLLDKMRKLDDSLRNCCSSIKEYLLARRFFGEREARDVPSGCEIFCDLSDRNTFFAWQRNHMANERTFLAWCRTGIAIIVFGFVIERFEVLIREARLMSADRDLSSQLHSTHFIGITAFALGAAIILIAGWRFFYIRKHINRGETEFSVLPDLFLMGSVLATVGTAFVFFAFIF